MVNNTYYIISLSLIFVAPLPLAQTLLTKCIQIEQINCIHIYQFITNSTHTHKKFESASIINFDDPTNNHKQRSCPATV